MSKQVNPNVGHVVCGYRGCAQIAVVRRNRGSALYQECLDCGRITPTGAGQQALEAAAVLWPQRKAPPGLPRWISEGWSGTFARHDPEAARFPAGATPGQSVTLKTPTQHRAPPETATPTTPGRPRAVAPPPPPPQPTEPAPGDPGADPAPAPQGEAEAKGGVFW